MERQVEIWGERSLKVLGSTWCGPGKRSTLAVQVGTHVSESHELTHSARSVLQELGRQQHNLPFKVFRFGERQGNQQSCVLWAGLLKEMCSGRALGEQGPAAKPKQEIFLKEMAHELNWRILPCWSEQERGGGLPSRRNSIRYIGLKQCYDSGNFSSSEGLKERMIAQNRTWNKAVTAKMVVKR